MIISQSVLDSKLFRLLRGSCIFDLDLQINFPNALINLFGDMSADSSVDGGRRRRRRVRLSRCVTQG